MRGFVTGATGFIGGILARALRSKGWAVTALVRSPGKAARLEADGIAVAAGDVTEPETLAAAIPGHDAVFHLAAWWDLAALDRERMHRINVGGTENVLRAATDAGIARIVHCSSNAALGVNPTLEPGDETQEHDGIFATIYEETKYRAHLVARSFAAGGAPVIIGIPCSLVYGPGDTSLIAMMLGLYARRVFVAAPFGGIPISWVHAADVADGIIAAHDRGAPGEEYILGGDNDTIRHVLQRIAPHTGIAPPRADVPRWVMRAALPLDPIVTRALKQQGALMRGALAMVRGPMAFTSAKAERELGYRWRTVEEGLPPVVEELRRRRAGETPAAG